MTKRKTFRAGTRVEVFDTHPKSSRVFAEGVVKSSDESHVKVKLDGQRKLYRFRIKDKRIVGYAWPALAFVLRKAKARR